MENRNEYDSVIVESEEDIIKFSNRGYDCQKIDEGKWLMEKDGNA